MKRLLCMLGLHKWSEWHERQPPQGVPPWKERYCLWYGRMQYKRVGQ